EFGFPGMLKTNRCPQPAREAGAVRDDGGVYWWAMTGGFEACQPGNTPVSEAPRRFRNVSYASSNSSSDAAADTWSRKAAAVAMRGAASARAVPNTSSSAASSKLLQADAMAFWMSPPSSP